MKKTITSLLLMLLVVVSAWGQTSGQCGDAAYWTLSSDGVLTISGTGVMMASPTFGSDKISIKEVVINEGITTIGATAFSGYYGINTVSFPTTLTEIGGSAFYGCTFKAADLSKCNELTTIGGTAFGTSSLETISFPASLTSIGSYAFMSTSIASIDLSMCDKITTIDYGTFDNCSSLTTFLPPASLTSIGSCAFMSVTSLQSIDFSKCNELTTIVSNAFSGCSSLSTISLPASLTTIENSSFQSCTSMATINLLAIAPPSLGQKVFDGVETDKVTVYVPTAGVNDYKAHSVWGTFNIADIASSGMVDASMDDSIVVEGNDIVLSEAQQVVVYTVSGALVYQGITNRITMDEAGVYIVKIASGTVKAIIR